MAIGLSASMITAEATLKAMQQSLAVTSNNIANASSSTYHKQVATLTDNVEILDNTGYYGTGVSVSSITRTYSTALEASLRDAQSSDGYNQTYLDYVSQCEDSIAPSGTSSITTSMSDFMDSLQNLETNPEDSTYREAVITGATTLADSLNSAYSTLNTIQSGIAATSGTSTTVTGTAADGVSSVNTILSQLSTLNDQISGLESNDFVSATANDLEDQRDSLVSQLSSYTNVNVTEDTDGRYTITTNDSSGNEVTLLGVTTDATTGVTSTYYNSLGISIDSTSGTNTIAYSITDGVTGTTTAFDPAEGEGELKAYQDSYDYLETQKSDLQTYASAISTAVNSQLALGLDLNGDAGADLFSVPASTSDGILSVTGITYDEIAANGSGTATETGDGSNMETLWNYLKSDTTSLGTYSLYDYSNAFVNSIAQDVETATNNADTSSSLVTTYKNAIASASGVNTDEELTNMLQIQQVYAAAAKLMSTIQNMWDTLLSAV